MGRRCGHGQVPIVPSADVVRREDFWDEDFIKLVLGRICRERLGREEPSTRSLPTEWLANGVSQSFSTSLMMWVRKRITVFLPSVGGISGMNAVDGGSGGHDVRPLVGSSKIITGGS